MKKIFSSIFILLFSSIAFAQIHVGILKGPSGIPMAYQMENVHSLNSLEVQYEQFANAQALLPKLIKGEIDIGFLPPNVAAKVYNSNNGCIKCAAVTGSGMLSFITKDASVKSISDLKGKTISVAGSGATPEYMLRYLLSKAGISCGSSKEDAVLDFSIPNADIAAALIADKIQYALVPEPFATVACTKDSSVLRAIDIQNEFKNESKLSSYPMTVIAVNSKFAESHKKEVKAFLDTYKKASDETLKNPGQIAKLCEKYSLGLNAAIVQKAIPNCAFTFKKAKDARKEIEALLSIFLEFDSKSIGAKLPDSGFYF